MKVLQILAVLVAGFIFAPGSPAAVYKYTDGQGHVHYTDRPPPSAHAKRVRLPELGSYSSNAEANLASPPPTQDKKKEKDNYQSLSVVSPKPGQTISTDGGAVHVEAGVEPRLHVGAGDRLVVYLDGQQVKPGPIPSVSLQLHGVRPGDHKVHVAIVDKRGETLKASDQVEFAVAPPGVKKNPR